MEAHKRDTHTQISCLLILTAIGVTYMLKVFATVLIPFVLAIFLTYCLTPFVDMQIRWMKCPRFLAIITTILIGVVILFLVALLVSAAVGEMTENKEAYQDQLDAISEKVVSALHLEKYLGIEEPNELAGSKLLDKSELPVESKQLDGQQPPVESKQLKETEPLGKKLFSIPAATVKTIFTEVINSIMSIISNGLLVIIFMIFMLSGKRASSTPSGGVRGEIENSIKRYSITLVLTSGVTGLLVGLTFTILGVDFAWMFGFLAFLLNFIPSIGSIVATILPIPVIILSPELSVPARILAIVIPTVIQFGIGNLLQPRLMGKSLNLHPVTVLLSLMFFGVIWGVVGMLMATPITAVLRMLFEKFEYTRQFAMIMAGDLESISK